MDHATTDSRFPVLADAEPAVSHGVVKIVAAGLVAGVAGVIIGAVAGFGFWGLVLSYVLAGNGGVACVIVTRARAG